MDDKVELTQESLLRYLDRLILLKQFPTQSFFVTFCKSKGSKQTTKLGYEIDCPIDAYQMKKLDNEIQHIKEKLISFDELKPYHLMRVQSKMNIQTNK
tara:strand:+ start:11647 stop:11940 length:294 start_codon:yes stop_codon:yes gene_type:complete